MDSQQRCRCHPHTTPWHTASVLGDLTGPDLTAVEAFYADLLGWSYQDTEEEYGGYAIAQVRSAAAAGIGSQQPGGQPAWRRHFAGDDADKTAAAVTGYGGAVLLPRLLSGRSPVCSPHPIRPTEDLRSPDPDSAGAFYTAVFGYRTQALPEAGPDYATFAAWRGGNPPAVCAG